MNDAGMFAPLAPAEVVEQPRPKPANKVPVVPVPADAPPCRFKHPKLGEPSQGWAYHDAEARLVGYVCRWDFQNEAGERDKEILPVTYCDLGNGRFGWRSKGIPAPRPLFGLPDILTRPALPILITEGEKARDAAAVLIPDMVATTPAHGAKSPQLTDFGPCAGRVVVIAPDYDEPGRKTDKGKPHHPGRDFGDKVAELARAAGAIEVLHLHPERLAAWRWQDGKRVTRGEPIPDGWDLADALPEGWTAETVADARSDPAFLCPYLDAAGRKAALGMLSGETGLPAPPDEDEPDWPFQLVWNGVEKRVERADKETGAVTVEWRWFCSPLEILADTRSAEGEEWGRLLLITDRDGRTKEWAMPMSMLAGDGTTYRERLLSLGLIMAPGKFARDCLHEYISTARPDEKARCVLRIGWQSKTYVGFDTNFGDQHG